MVQRLLGTLAFCCALVASPYASAADLLAQLFPLTGEVRLVNPNAAAMPFVFLSVESPSGALDGSSAIWKSITENYDRAAGLTPGNGFIDPNGDWIKLASDTTELTEGALDLDGGSLPAFRAISLGYIWDPDHVEFPDLTFDIQSDVAPLTVNVELALDGDYSTDHIVDAGDYQIWRKYVDSMTAYFADGDLDGVVDLDDYLVWQQNFGVTLPLPPYTLGGGNGAAVPEPGTAVLAGAFALLATLVGRRPRRA